MQQSYDWFIDENPEVIERVVQGEARGEFKGLQKSAVNIVKFSFPELEEFEQQQVEHIGDPVLLNVLMDRLMAAPSKDHVCKVLEVFAA